jgi:UrcA family protein
MNTIHVLARINVRVLLAGLASAYLGLGAAISQAADDDLPGERRTSVVQYGDLNLASPQGVQRLYQRIVASANEVCDSGDHRSLQAFAHDRKCKERSVARAVAAVGRPELTALYVAKTSRPTPNPSKLVQR